MVVPYNENHAQATPPADGPARPKRPVSEAKRLANIANAGKAAAARSAAGKAAVAGNAVTHGQTCNNPTIFLPGENPEEYAQQVDRWSVALGAQTEPEVAQVGLAVYQLWKLRRTRTATAAAVTRKVEAIDNDIDDHNADEVRDLIPQLPIDPARVVRHLRKTVCGCSFLLGQLRLVRARLDTHSAFEVSQRGYSLQLLGHNPADVFTDPLVFELDRLYFGAISGPGSFTAAEAANALLHDRKPEITEEEFERRLEPMVNNLPTIVEGYTGLVRIVEQAIEELTERIELLELREERQKSLEAIEAQDDGSPEADKRERHEGMAVRLHHASMREFRAMREARRKHGTGDLDRLNESNHEEQPEASVESPTGTEKDATFAERRATLGGEEASVASGEDATFAERRATLGGREVPAGSGNETLAQGDPAAAEIAAQNNATVPQVSERDARCNEAPAQSEPPRQPAPPASLVTGHLYGPFQEMGHGAIFQMTNDK
jgi:hypothetical protein